MYRNIKKRLRTLTWSQPRTSLEEDNLQFRSIRTGSEEEVAEDELTRLMQECLGESRIRRVDPPLYDVENRFDPDEDEELFLEVLLPTGMLMDLVASPAVRVGCLKRFILHQTINPVDCFPLSGLIVREPNLYTLTCITRKGLLMVMEEDQTLDQCNIGQPFIKMSKLQENDKSQQRLKKIGTLVGKNLTELENMQNTEIKDFRWNMQNFVLKIAKERKLFVEQDWRHFLQYYFPSRISFPSPSACFSPLVKSKLGKVGNRLRLSVVKTTGAVEHMEVASCVLPSQIIRMCGEQEDSCLKIFCREEYLVTECPIINYDTLRDMFMEGSPISLLVWTKDLLRMDMENESVYEIIHNDYDIRPKMTATPGRVESRQSAILSSVRINKRFSLYLDFLFLRPHNHFPESRVLSDLYLVIGIYHGSKSLSSEISIDVGAEVEVTEGEDGDSAVHKYILDRTVEMDICVANLPRTARLCFGLYRQRVLGTESIAWVNTNIFDYNRLMKKQLCLHFINTDLHCTVSNTEQILFPIKHSEQNKNFKEASSLALRIMKSIKGKQIGFPPDITEADLINEDSESGSDSETRVNIAVKFDENSSLQGSEDSLYPRSDDSLVNSSGSNLSFQTVDTDTEVIVARTKVINGGNLESDRGHEKKEVDPRLSSLLFYANLTETVPGSGTSVLEAGAGGRTSRPGSDTRFGKHTAPKRRTLIRDGSVLTPHLKINKMFNEELKRIGRRDSLHPMSSEEINLLKGMKESCGLDHPTILPRIIDCIDYTNYTEVRDLHRLLLRWPTIPLEYAMELLDYKYPDERVHEFAVRCLREGGDERLEFYLHQLVQAIKHQNFFDSCLVKFLLERTLRNQRLGHKFYWILKCEIRLADSTLKFALILEAYLLGAPGHMKILDRQRDFMSKLKTLSNSLGMVELSGQQQQEIREKKFMESLGRFFSPAVLDEGFICPIDATLRCAKLSLDNCKLMKSKKMPVKLVFDHYDNKFYQEVRPQEKICFIYKTGDDLRQDNLVLNMIKVFDTIWKEGGVDYKMNSYECIPTSDSEGLIKVVEGAETVCNIQIEESCCNSSGLIKPMWSKMTAAFRSALIYRWICRHHSDADSLTRALENFEMSFAGYTVAMYVLGIGDRHNDNIMLQRNGKIFHIDFGHILGRFKSKLGIRRERTPMILPPDFIYVLQQKGPQQLDSFRTKCEQAYLMLRECGSLVISLLSMMVSTGLPHLQSEEDLLFVRRVLQLDDDIGEQAALDHFRSEFDASLRASYTTRVNFFIHMMKQIIR